MSNIINKLIQKTRAYNDVAKELKAEQVKSERFERQCKAVQRDNDRLCISVGKITDRVCSTEVQCDGNRLYRICIELNRHEIELCLEHGNDSTFIRYMGDKIGCKVAEDIRSLNFVRQY